MVDYLASYDRTNIGTRHFVYDTDGRVIGEYGSSASDVKAEFIWALPPGASSASPFGGGDEIMGYAPLALVTENGSSQLELYWVHGNHLGVPLVTTNASGQVVTPGSDFLRPGFPGQSQVLSDLYYNRARDYDPWTGRYLQADPIGLWGGSNPYLYADADPVNLIDPLGLFQAPAAPNPLLIRVAPRAAIFYGISLTLAVANEMVRCRPTMTGSLPSKWSQFCNHASDTEDECEMQEARDNLDCLEWDTSPPRYLGGLSRTEGYTICIRTARVSAAECRTRGGLQFITTPPFIPGNRRRNIHDGGDMNNDFESRDFFVIIEGERISGMMLISKPEQIVENGYACKVEIEHCSKFDREITGVDELHALDCAIAYLNSISNNSRDPEFFGATAIQC